MSLRAGIRQAGGVVVQIGNTRVIARGTLTRRLTAIRSRLDGYVNGQHYGCIPSCDRALAQAVLCVSVGDDEAGVVRRGG